MEFLIEKGFRAELGVRHLRRVMDEELHAPWPASFCPSAAGPPLFSSVRV